MSNRKTLAIIAVALALLCACMLTCAGAAYFWVQGRTGEAAGLGTNTTDPDTVETLAVTPESSGAQDSGSASPKDNMEDPGGLTGGAVGPVSEGGLVRLSGEMPPTLDPALVQDNASAQYVVHIFSGLVTLNSGLEIVPDLAMQWSLEDGDRTYVFALNPDARFADGSPITAEDIVYSWERACGPELASPVAPGYMGDIVGVKEFAAGQADFISGLEIRDEHTLAVTIDAPKAYFLAKLTYPAAMIVDRTRVEDLGEGWILDPNGSGPFVLESLTEDLIVLERNVNYYGVPARVERVEFDLGGGLPITMYENDQLDIVGVYADELDRVMDPHNPLSAELSIAQELSTEYLAMDVTRSPFDDPAVRRAVLRAIDREKLAGLVLNNSAVAGRGILPPGLVTADPDPAAGIMAYDPEEARRLLASSRYAAKGAMPPIVLTISGTSGYLDGVTEAVLAMLEENLGLVVTVEQVEWSSFLTDLNDQTYAFYESGWIADYPDPQNFLDLLFHSESSQNHTGYANPQVDAILEEARVEQDHYRRMALYGQAEVLILGDAPWVPLTHGLAYTLVKPYIQGYQAGAGLFPWLKDVYITP